jgi:PAS domain S-box-containing protein
MKDEDKTKEQLIGELAKLRQRIAQFEASETERKRVEGALRESQEFNSSLLDDSPNPISVINPDTSIRYVNPALEKLAGFSFAELVGSKAPYQWWMEETPHKTRRDFKEAMRQGERKVEECFQKKNGERFCAEVTSTPVTSNGKLRYYLSNWVDVTQRKRVEEALRESEERNRALVGVAGQTGLGIVILQDTEDREGAVIFANEEIAAMLSCSRVEMLTSTFRDFVPAGTLAAMQDRYRWRQRGEDAPGNYEVTAVRKDGSVVVFDISAGVMAYCGKPATVAYLRDITERKWADDLLEIRIEERTVEVAKTGEQLHIEINKRKEVEKKLQALREQEKKLRQGVQSKK